MNAAELLELIPDDLLEELSVSTEIDRYAKKLQGKVIFKLLIYCIVTHKDNSLRKMESAFESMGFAIINNEKPKQSI